MFLGCAINLFSGQELIPFFCKELRNHIDYIIVMYQQISFSKNQINKETIDFLRKLKNEKLIDDYFCFNFQFKKHIKKIETDKRNYCIKKLKEKNCTHHLICDVDEFYMKEQFKWAKKKIIKDKLNVTYCNSIDYCIFPTLQKKNKKNLKVPFICKIDQSFQFDKRIEVKLIDKSRRIFATNIYLFERKKLLMHHMKNVRKDEKQLIIKYENKPHYRLDRKKRKLVEKKKKNIKNHKYEDIMNKKRIKVVPNYFNINF